MTTATTDLAELILSEHDSLTEFRRDLHAHPELGYQETRTSEAIQRELAAAGAEFKAGFADGTGIVAHIPATTDAPVATVGLRADIDALPIHEQTGKPWASKTEGVMHACGHDGHTAILLGVARALIRTPSRPNAVTLLFQPAEEGGGGGQLMCRDGALKGEAGGGLGTPVDRIFGLHNAPDYPLNSIATKGGALLAATDEFNITIRGGQAHAAFPHYGRDPVVAACQLVTAFQTISSRNRPPADPMVLSVTQVHTGFTHNVIPNEAIVSGTLRTVTAETRAMAERRMREITEHLCRAMECGAEIEWLRGYPVTRNNDALADHVLDLSREVRGVTEIIRLTEPFLGGEDFSYYGEHVPACFFLLGTQPADETNPALLHQPAFDFNDDAIPLGVEMFCRLAMAPGANG